MCDAQPANTASAIDTILAGCLAHSRRRFVDVVDTFPAEVRHVLETVRAVYRNDALARTRALSPDERLRLHSWNAEKMAQRGTDFTDRGKVLHERIAATKETWTRDALEYHGTSVSFDRIWS